MLTAMLIFYLTEVIMLYLQLVYADGHEYMSPAWKVRHCFYSSLMRSRQIIVELL